MNECVNISKGIKQGDLKKIILNAATLSLSNIQLRGGSAKTITFNSGNQLAESIAACCMIS